ncbi:MAG TPA: hypothetical protein VJN96_03675 [Vicinamibacterales bacterium]|nr:hypothetical protein [Vicinamibacterales bacterium]
MTRKKTVLDRFIDFLHPKPATAASSISYRWWFVANRVTTGMVITDEASSIVIAPIEWNRFIGTTLDVLLGQTGASAVSIPGPYAKARE